MLLKQAGLISIGIIQNLSTPIIASIALLIAYRQWRTSREKLVLDLFERRYEIYRHICDACTILLQTGKMDEAARRSLATAVLPTKFLFGKEVEVELDAFWKDTLWMTNFDSRYEVSKSDARDRMDRRREELFAKANSLLEGNTFKPYMKIDARL